MSHPSSNHRALRRPRKPGKKGNSPQSINDLIVDNTPQSYYQQRPHAQTGYPLIRREGYSVDPITASTDNRPFSQLVADNTPAPANPKPPKHAPPGAQGPPLPPGWEIPPAVQGPPLPPDWQLPPGAQGPPLPPGWEIPPAVQGPPLPPASTPPWGPFPKTQEPEEPVGFGRGFRKATAILAARYAANEAIENNNQEDFATAIRALNDAQAIQIESFLGGIGLLARAFIENLPSLFFRGRRNLPKREVAKKFGRDDRWYRVYEDLTRSNKTHQQAWDMIQAQLQQWA